ncbi:MAG: pseudaminic acid synthase [Dehalococcoidia bacterium]|nr:pseudaminic acid synthase [Dehalococcoidia bacterium]
MLPVIIVAEMGASHCQRYDVATNIVEGAIAAGADAIKVQCYTPDTLTIRSRRPEFRIGPGSPWEGKTLYELYEKAYMPWDWIPKLAALANSKGAMLFASVYDKTAIDFVCRHPVFALKIASFEMNDIPLIKYAASKGKPLIVSTGMATEGEIKVARNAAGSQCFLLKCVSAYPAKAEDANLGMIRYMSEDLNAPVGISDHGNDSLIPILSVAAGACMIEKHYKVASVPGPDDAFAFNFYQFRDMVRDIRKCEGLMGDLKYGPLDSELPMRKLRRSLYATKRVRAGERFTEDNVRSIRPANGLPPTCITAVLQQVAHKDIPAGTPLSLKLLRGGK